MGNDEYGFKPVVFEKGGFQIREAEKKGCLKISFGEHIEFIERNHIESLLGNIIAFLDKQILEKTYKKKK